MLLDLIMQTEDYILPSLKELAVKCGVSKKKLRAVLEVLKEEKVVNFWRGSHIYICNYKKKPSKKCTSELLYNSIKMKIVDGTLRFGDELPKRELLIREYHVSPNTITKVCERLESELFIQRKGRKFIIGNKRDIDIRLKSFQSLVIIIAKSEATWNDLESSPRTRFFVQGFLDNAERRNIRLILATQKTSPYQFHTLTISELGVYITQIKDNFLGFLLVVSLSEMPDFKEVLSQLSSFKKPIVWFDRNGDGAQVQIDKQNVFRCSYNENNMVHAALEHLHSRKHSKILFYMKEREGWQQTRFIKLVQEAALINPTSMIIPHFDWNPFEHRYPVSYGVYDVLQEVLEKNWFGAGHALQWFVEKKSLLLNTFSEFAPLENPDSKFNGYCAFMSAKPAKVNDFISEAINQGKKIWPVLGLFKILNDRSITAILVANDSLAVERVIPHIQRLSLPTPQRISILSFDNLFRTSYMKINSVDPNFNQLGFTALQLLYDPAMYNENDNIIYNKPYVVDYGSVRKMTR